MSHFRELAQHQAQEDVGPATRHGPTEDTEIPVEGGETETGHFLETERSGQSLVDQGIGIMVAVIVVGAVAIPVADDVIANVSVGGTTEQILGYVPLALGVGLFVAAISIVR